MRAITASIVHKQANTAGRQVADELLAELEGRPELVLVFIASTHDANDVVAGMRARLGPDVEIVGCSSHAEINTEEALTHSVTAMGLVLGDVKARIFKLDSLGEDHRAAGRALAHELEPFEPKVIVALPDGLVTNPVSLIRGVQDVLGEVPLVGGLAADNFEFERTVGIHNDQVVSGGLVGVAFAGPIVVGTAARAGFQPISETRVCTRVEGKLVLELDHKPALDIYMQFLDSDVDIATAGIEFPLLMISGTLSDYMNSDQSEHVVRAVRTMLVERGALMCGVEIPEGATVRMSRAAREDIIKAATLAVESARSAVAEPAAALLFNCAGRKLILGAGYNDEVDAAISAIGADVPTIGFYTYGEFSPVGDRNNYHEETFTVVLLGTE